MILNSIRWRVQAWHGLILLIVLVGFGLTAYRVVSENLLRQVDKDLQQKSAQVFLRPPGPPDGPRHGKGLPERMATEGAPGERGAHMGPRREEFDTIFQQSLQRIWSEEPEGTNSFYYVLWREDGKIAGSSSNAPAGVLSARPETIAPEFPEHIEIGPPPEPGPRLPILRTRGHFREALHSLPFGNGLLIGRSMAAELATMRRVAIGLFAAGSAVLALGLAGGWWLASRAIAPVEEISATALKIAGGDLSQRINAADAVTELERVASVLNSTFARLEASFGHQARFTSDASHELRTPVTVILSQTQTALSRERSPAEYRQALEACQRAAQRMRKLTESLLELARLDAGQEPMRRERFDLSRVARECLDLVRPLAVDRGIEFTCALPEVQCAGDPERIAQVVTNLLTNAIQFNREGGNVRISCAAENHKSILRVEDTGMGIAAEDMPHIFERFYRVDKSRSGAHGRSGLGLAISKAIIEAHSGSIDVSSHLGAGSTFTVKLPLT